MILRKIQGDVGHPEERRTKSPGVAGSDQEAGLTLQHSPAERRLDCDAVVNVGLGDRDVAQLFEGTAAASDVDAALAVLEERSGRQIGHGEESNMRRRRRHTGTTALAHRSAATSSASVVL